MSADAGMLAPMAARGSPFGRVTLVSGPESLLADRAVDAVRQQIGEEVPEAEVTETEAVGLDRGKLTEITSASLFASRRAA
ncbi:MAG TPA: DNA polymerase III subunit delta, partial [Propionibacteriaceae bacterium]|nr:DNA polymerase III subunit delta [Propionibacteriaceae bacterium]